MTETQREICTVVDYFAFFSYPPSFADLHTYISIKITEDELKKAINELLVQKILLRKEIDKSRYARANQTEFFKLYAKKFIESSRKIRQIRLYLSLISYIPWIQYVGFSGSLAMNNARKESDVDLFIITKNKRLWTIRFFMIVLAQLLGLRRVDHSARICLNLFFDESDLQLRKEKRTLYCAHELVQLRTIIDKDNQYERLVGSNNWIYKFFPNLKKPKQLPMSLVNSNLGWIENALKRLQLTIINKRLTQEYITDTQLWLLQNDFEVKMNKVNKR